MHKRFLVYLINMLILILVVLGVVIYSYFFPADPVSSPNTETSSSDQVSNETDTTPESNDSELTPPSTSEEDPSAAVPEVPAYSEPEDPDPSVNTVEEQVQTLLDSMTLREKIYQMFFVTPESLTGYERVTAAGDATKQALKTYPVGGLIYFSGNLIDREQTITMLKNSQSYSQIPLFLGVDEEGGLVSRVGANSAMGTTYFPDMAQYGQAGDTEAVYQVGQTLGRELSDLGFNLDFAPVADIVTNPDNTEIGNRSFSSDPEIASQMVSALVTGLQEKKVLSCLKHFPGHGSTSADSHSGLSVSSRTSDELRQAELLPFSAGIDAGSAFVMISHMSLPNVVGDNTPCDLSYTIVTELLREELGFDGLIITDSHAMGAITQYYTSAEAAIAAVKAGVDMILMPANLEEAAVAVMRAVEKGEISEEQIDESVYRILHTKYTFGIIQ